ncbi:MAG: ATP-binding protein, partial [Gammaproteobacteria bacterium]|nr:ATP-binding protein [Gammaproteobacteria bacterium]
MSGPLPDWGRHTTGPVCLIYGPPDVGKTALIRRTAAHSMVCFHPRGTLKGDFAVAGHTPQPWQNKEVDNLFALLKLLPKYAARKEELWAKGIRWVGIDDVTVMAEESMPLIERLLAKQQNRSGYAKWTMLMELLNRFRRMVRTQMGMGVMITGHDRRRDVDDDGEEWIGGPKFPSKGRTADLVKLTDVCARYERRLGWRRWPLWDGVFCIGDDPENWF